MEARRPEHLVPVLAPVMDRLEDLLDVCSVAAADILRATPGVAGDRLDQLLRYRGEPPIILKVTAYQPTSTSAVRPHVDRAVLSMIMHYSDPATPVRVAPMGSGRVPEPAVYPVETPTGTGAIVLGGALLADICSQPVSPALHSVRPVGPDTIRHTAVAFVHIPHHQTSHVKVRVEDD